MTFDSSPAGIVAESARSVPCLTIRHLTAPSSPFAPPANPRQLCGLAPSRPLTAACAAACTAGHGHCHCHCDSGTCVWPPAASAPLCCSIALLAYITALAPEIRALSHLLQSLICLVDPRALADPRRCPAALSTSLSSLPTRPPLPQLCCLATPALRFTIPPFPCPHHTAGRPLCRRLKLFALL